MDEDQRNQCAKTTVSPKLNVITEESFRKKMQNQKCADVVEYFAKSITHWVDKQDSLGYDAYQFTKSVMRVQADFVAMEAHLRQMHTHSNAMLSKINNNVN